MKLYTHVGADGGIREYKISYNGTYYNSETPDAVIRLLEYARNQGYYVWLRLGDKETGRDWLDDCDVTGYVSRSTGPIKIPILLPTKRSIGGGGILTHCIIKLVVKSRKGLRETWTAENYQVPELGVGYSDTGTDKSWVVRVRSGEVCEVVARFESPRKAKRWTDFITGRRLNR